MTDRGHVRRLGLFIGAALAAAALAALAFIEPKEAAAGWLVSFAFWSQVPIGSLTLLMIHRLTGGRWGEALRPALESAACAIPWLLVLIVPILLALPVLYPWARDPGAAPPDVSIHYLNGPLFIARSIVALAGWSALAILLPRLRGRAGQLLAAVGLVFHGVMVSSIAVDWMLSLEPPFVSSSFGASVAITQLVAAMAWVAVSSIGSADERVVGDIGGFLLAFALGITYVDFMAVLVIWYGDLPHEVLWFIERTRPPWLALGLGAFILASVVPILGLLLAGVRTGRRGLRAVATSALLGLALYHIYLIAPPFGAAALPPALLALIAPGLLLAGVTAGDGSAMFARWRPVRVH
jgi:hypothetical protein